MTWRGLRDSLAGHMLARAMPPALLLLVAMGGVFLWRERQMVDTRLTERLERGVEGIRNVLFEKLAAAQGQARMIAENDLVKNALIDVQDQNRYLPYFFRSLGPVAGSKISARISLLDYRERELISNERPGGPSLGDLGKTRALSTEFLYAGVRGLLIVAPVLLHGYDEGAVALSMDAVSLSEFVGPQSSAFGLALYDGGGRLMFANEICREEAGTARMDELPGWLSVREDFDLKEGLSFQLLAGLPPGILAQEMA